MPTDRRDLFEELTPTQLQGRIPALRVSSGIAKSMSSVLLTPSSSSPSRLAENLENLRFLKKRGWFDHSLATPDECHALTSAIADLRAAALPPLLVYTFDEAWVLGARACALASSIVGARYDLLADLWAFHIEPGRSGWVPHRGAYGLLDRAQPEYLNVWIALSDAAAHQSCMHFVPLDDDPAYRARSLENVDVPASKVAAAPLREGGVLAWNANVLHWGGECAVTSAPRISMTFTLRRADVTAAASDPAVIDSEDAMNAWTRLEIIARQIRVYGALDASVSDAVKSWAEVTVQMADRLRQRT